MVRCGRERVTFLVAICCSDGPLEIARIGQFSAKDLAAGPIDFAAVIRLNVGLSRVESMQKPIITFLLAAATLLSVPASAQTKLTPKNAASRADLCAPIGRTANGDLVYSMKCDTIPAPPQTRIEETAPPPPAPAPQQETTRSGIFGWSYDHRDQ
jgi:hypothetical protein